jgi:hypothetical protein
VTISSGVLSADALSFSIDVEPGPQSDDFHGLWEDFGSGKILNISGKGSGVARGANSAEHSMASSHSMTRSIRRSLAFSSPPTTVQQRTTSFGF